MQSELNENVDPNVAAGFGHEWSTFTQGEDLAPEDRQALFNAYFAVFPWHELPPEATGIDVGCGSGRWSSLVAPRVGHLHLLDASVDALAVAKTNLASNPNTTFHLASVGNIPLADASLDFAFSLGVLHHVPDTLSAIKSVAAKLRPGAPFLIYLYYALDNRPAWFRALWQISDVARRGISRLPPSLKLAMSQIIAATVYWPLARAAKLADRVGVKTASFPLDAYKSLSFYVMRTDAYDRFCTSLEQRFSRLQIESMLTEAGFQSIVFSESMPYWCAVGRKR